MFVFIGCVNVQVDLFIAELLLRNVRFIVDVLFCGLGVFLLVLCRFRSIFDFYI